MLSSLLSNTGTIHIQVERQLPWSPFNNSKQRLVNKPANWTPRGQTYFGDPHQNHFKKHKGYYKLSFVLWKLLRDTTIRYSGRYEPPFS
eukprot:2178850-Amphidinium_carterae.2